MDQQNNIFGANPNEGDPGKFDFEDFRFRVWRKYQNTMDRITVYKQERWIFLFSMLILHALRVYLTQGMS